MAGAWRHTVGAGLTRTLGFTNQVGGVSSRKCGAQRRGLNSHKAAQPRVAQDGGSLVWPLTKPSEKLCASALNHMVAFSSCQVSASRQSAEATEALLHGRPFGSVALRWWAATCCILWGVSQQSSSPAWVAWSGSPSSSVTKGRSLGGTLRAFLMQPPVKPNPSLKPSPNGGPPGPAHRYAVHFLCAGPGVPPLVPA